MIRTTFHEATRTVILDHDLGDLSRNTPSHELFRRLAISDWGRRLWTYEEFVVSEDHVVILCNDGFLNVAICFQNLESRFRRPVQGLYTYDSWDTLRIPEQMY